MAIHLYGEAETVDCGRLNVRLFCDIAKVNEAEGWKRNITFIWVSKGEISFDDVGDVGCEWSLIESFSL